MTFLRAYVGAMFGFHPEVVMFGWRTWGYPDHAVDDRGFRLILEDLP